NSQFNRDANGNQLLNSSDEIEEVMRNPTIWRSVIEEDEGDPPLVLAFGGDPQAYLPLVLNFTRENQGNFLPKSARLLATFEEIEKTLTELSVEGFGNKTFSLLLTDVTNSNDTKLKRFWGKTNNTNYFYVGFSLSSYGIISNQTVLEQNNARTPSSWEQLADKQYLDLLELPILESTNRMAQRIFETVLQVNKWEKGWTIITQTYANANESRLEHSNYYIVKDLYKGLAGVGWTKDPPMLFNTSLQLNRPSLNETFIDHQPCAVLSNALQNNFSLEFCARFLAFLLSIEDYEHNPGGQTINLISGNSPVNPKTMSIVKNTPELIQNLVTLINSTPQEVVEQRIDQIPNLAELILNTNISDLFVLDEISAYQRAPVIQLLFDTMILDSFSDLKNAWLTMLEKENETKFDIDQIGKIPINQTEAIEIGLTLLVSDTYDLWESYYNEWKSFAKNKYETVKEGEPFTGTKKKRIVSAFNWEFCMLLLILLPKKLHYKRK
ncbi:MAG: hypothetical protein ACFFCQ_17260, partial [Promethearchaeota archaeon]